jgi:hypothetical protein
VVLGLCLGWYAAGVIGPGGAGLASDTVAAVSSDGHASSDHSARHDEDNPAAAMLPQAESIPWLRPVLYAALALFVAAVVLGIPAMMLKGPDPPEPDAPNDH